MSNVLQQQIASFTIHEETPVDSIIADHQMDVVIAALTNLLSSTDAQTISRTLGFVRDAALYAHPRRDAFHEQLRSSTIWENFRALLRAPSFMVRRNTIYTIGKLTYPERASLLEEAFPFYFEKDPLNLPSLLQELRWLTRKWNWEFLQRMASSSYYLHRWALCDLLDDRGDNVEIAQRFVSLFSPLVSDSHVCVAAEANFRLERIKIKLGPKLPKSQWRAEVKRIAQLQPRITSSQATEQFMRDREDYENPEFDRFLSEALLNSRANFER